MRTAVTILVLLLAGPIGAQEEESELPTDFEGLVAAFEAKETKAREKRRILTGLGQLEDERARAWLIEAFPKQATPSMKVAVLDALVLRPATKEVRYLVEEQLDSSKPYQLRYAAARIWPKVDPDWRKRFRMILADESQKALHSNLVYAITYGGGDDAFEFLVEILDRHEESLGPITINYATSRFGLEKTWKIFLRPYLRKQAEEALRFAAIAALGNKQDERFLDSLKKLLSKQERRKSATRWLRNLGRLDDPAAFALMREMVEGASSAAERQFIAAARTMKHERILRWFRDRGTKSDELAIERSAIESMAFHPDERNVKVLQRLARGEDDEIAAAAIAALSKQPGEKTEPALRLLIERAEPDRAADALAACAQLLGDDETFVAELIKIAGQSRDWQMRVVALQLLQVEHGGSAREVIRENAAHRHAAVRMAAYEALTYLREKESVDLLIERLDEEEGRPFGEVVAALGNLTGTQWGRRVERWKSWWPKVRDELPLPPRPERAVVVADDDAERYGFYGIQVDSKRVVFVIDVSSSMSAQANKGTVTRIYQAKNELKNVLERFDESYSFEIIAFTGTPRAYAGKLVKATDEERGKAREWVDELKAVGGTNIYDSLEMAILLDEVDTVFLLSDGSPGVGKYVDTDRILEAIDRLNRYRRVRIHGIGIGVAGNARRLVEELARRNRGSSVIL